MRIVGNTKLVWDGQQQSVRLDDCLIFAKLFDKRMRLGSVATAKDRSRLLVQKANFVVVVTGAPKVKTILVVKQRKILRLTEMRGVRVWPASFQALRKARI